MSPFYWERHPDGPFVTLIAVAATYLDPENYHLDSLKELARREGDEEMRVFKSELREALRDPGQLPGDELLSQSSTTTAATRRSCAGCGTNCTATSRSRRHPACSTRTRSSGSWTLENSWPWCRAPASPSSAAGGH